MNIRFYPMNPPQPVRFSSPNAIPSSTHPIRRRDMRSDMLAERSSVANDKLEEVHERIDDMEKSMKALQHSLDRIMPVMAAVAKKEGVAMEEDDDEGELV